MLRLYELVTYYFQIRGQNYRDVEKVIDIVKRQPFQDELDISSDQVVIVSMIIRNFFMLYAQYPASTISRSQHIVYTLPDQGTTCIQIFYPSSSAKKQYEDLHPHSRQSLSPAVYFFPGLTQTDRSFKNIVVECVEKRGLAVVVVNRRGLCEKLTTPIFHIAGSDDDTLFVLTKVYEMPYFKGRPMLAFGVSMGGLILSRYLGNYSQNRHVDGIVAAATMCSPIVPMDVKVKRPMINSSLKRGLYKTFAMPYEKYRYAWEEQYPTIWSVINSQLKSFVPTSLTKLNGKKTKRDSLISVQQPPSSTQMMEALRIRHLNNLMKYATNIYEVMFLNLSMLENPEQTSESYQNLMKQYGLSTLETMIRENSPIVWQVFWEKYASAKNFHKINVPILVVHAENDQVVQVSDYSKNIIASCPNSVHLITKSGSHCDYRSSTQHQQPWDVFTFSWIDKVIFDFFELKSDAVY